MFDQSLGMPDEKFWGGADAGIEAAADKLIRTPFEGIQLAAPGLVSLDAHQTLPVIAFRAGTYRNVWAVRYEKHALLTAMDLENNRLYAGYLVNQEKEIVPRDPAQAPEGNKVATSKLDAREHLAIPWEPTTYLLTAIMRGDVSNRAKVKLGASAGAFQDAEVEKILAAEREKLAPVKVNPPETDPFPSYSKRDDSPPIPDEPGIALSVDRVVIRKEGAICILKGAFRLPALAREIVKPPRADSPAPVQPPPTAIIGITLLITGSEEPIPATYRLDVPSFDAIVAGAEKPVVTGYFALDLLAEEMLSVNPQTSFIYAFSGEVLAGPALSAVMTPAMLPK